MSSHVYAVQGTYNATLAVRDPFNLSFVNSSVATVTIADGVPHVSFTWTPASPSEGQDVLFNDTSTSFDAVVEVNWTVDGVLVSSGLSHSITRQMDDGTHNVTLQVRDEDGSVNSTLKAITVNRMSPSVTISSPSSASEGSPVLFYAVVDAWHTTIDTIASHDWNFSYTSGPFVSQVFTGTTNHTSHVFQSSAAHANFTVALKVTDEDGDSAIAFTNITVYDVAVVIVSCTTPEPLFEFMQVNFTATVDSAYTADSFDWDFDADPSGFEVDATTASGAANHTYVQAQYYLVKVRASMSNGSYAYGSASVYPDDLGLSGTADDLLATRDPGETSNISFDARAIAARYPDVNRTVWDFGDSATWESASGPVSIVRHKYNPDRDYTVTLTLTDDDGNTLVIHETLKLNAPVIELRSPADGSVVRSGTAVRYSITDDSLSLVSVTFSLDGGTYQNFTHQWEVLTDAWPDGTHTVVVRAEDPDGNVAYGTTVSATIDDQGPAVTVQAAATVVFGGSKMNVTVLVDDPNIAANGV
ncbi:MAG TPA: PKD domain-containing protein, partial [Candidatus Paceibacterota bacterium]|nr:PKD domain-containing protein [Candidatus Paceibacterota bacterium]